MLTFRKYMLAALMTAVTAVAFAPHAQAAYSQRKAITIDHARVEGSTTLSNFPVLVRIQNDGDLMTIGNGGHVVSSAGNDIIFLGSDGVTQLDHELQSYDGATGTLIAWVKVPSVSPSTDTVFYMDYGNSSVHSPTENPAGVWDDDYEMVLHLRESGNGTLYEYRDSSGSGHHGTGGGATRSPNRVEGLFGYAQDFDGNDDYITIGNVLGSVNAFTVSAWVKPENLTTTIERYITLGENVVLRHDGIKAVRSLHFYIKTDGTLKHVRGYNALETGVWRHVAGTWDGTTQRLFANGSEL